MLRRSRAECLLVVAPAGYGKTTLLSEWAATEERDVAWVTLDERHDDPALLIRAIATAIAPMHQLDEAILAPLASPQPNVARVVIPRLCKFLAGQPAFVLVLDDAHTVRSKAGREVLATLSECLPPADQLVLSAREEPQISLGRLRAERLVTELGAEDLAMTRLEASRLFRACGLSLDAEVVARLVERTEGWSAALYLAAKWLLGEPDPESASVHFAGDDRFVADYLRDEFLSTLDELTLQFLVDASLLDRLSGEVCDFVLERSGSAADLRRLSRSNLLLVPLDHRDHEYRFHPLLREMLGAELRGRGGERERELHARSSHWYARHGDFDRAVDHAIESGDVEMAGRLIGASTPGYAASGRQATLVRWLGAFDDETIEGSAPLCLTAAVVALVDADEGRVQRWALAAENALEDGERPDEAGFRAGIAMIRALSGTAHDVHRTAEELVQSRRSLPADLPWRSLSHFAEGAMRHLGGDRVGGRRALTEGVGVGSAAAPNPASLSMIQLALIALDEEDVEGAWRLAHRALTTVEHYGLEEYPTSSVVFATAAMISAMRGDTGAAARRAATAEALLARAPNLNPWLQAEARVAQARTLIRLDDAAGARAHLATASRSAQRIQGAVVLGGWLELAGREADAAAAVAERWPLTPAEIRLLHHLPTHHSFPKIAEQLFVSTNTVKTQAQSIYRKFNVTSRAEAVEVARAAGLLKGERDGRL